MASSSPRRPGRPAGPLGGLGPRVLAVALAVAAGSLATPARATICEDYQEAWGQPSRNLTAAKDSARDVWVELVAAKYGFRFIDVINSRGRGTVCQPAARPHAGAGWQCLIRARPCEYRSSRD
jgi:hypothetical protein